MRTANRLANWDNLNVKQIHINELEEKTNTGRRGAQSVMLRAIHPELGVVAFKLFHTSLGEEVIEAETNGFFNVIHYALFVLLSFSGTF